MCAKVTGPLLSFDASGTIGKAATFSKWKGRNYTRLRVIPRNPKSADQGSTRTIIGGFSKLVRLVTKTGSFYTQLIAVTPSDQSWNSYLVKNMIGPDAATYDTVKAQYENVANATVAGYFDAAAVDISLADYQLPYTPSGDEMFGGLNLMIAFQAAHDLGLAIAPVNAVSASEGQVDAFAAALVA